MLWVEVSVLIWCALRLFEYSLLTVTRFSSSGSSTMTDGILVNVSCDAKLLLLLLFDRTEPCLFGDTYDADFSNATVPLSVSPLYLLVN